LEAYIQAVPGLLNKWQNLLQRKYSLRRALVILSILCLSLADAFFTLVLLEKGGIELNPVMASAIERGVVPFILSKHLLTSFGLLVLCVFGYKKLAKSALVSLLLFYSVLFCIHLSFFLSH